MTNPFAALVADCAARTEQSAKIAKDERARKARIARAIRNEQKWATPVAR